MKVIKVLLILIITLTCFIRCISWSSDHYSFTENGNKTAEIEFLNSGFYERCIQLISIDGEAIPLPKSRKVWNPVQIPAERPLTLILNLFQSYIPERKPDAITLTNSVLDLIIGPIAAVDHVIKDLEQDAGAGWINMDVIFICPPLEAGKKYRLDWSSSLKEPRERLEQTLILKDTRTKKIIYKQDVYGNGWKYSGSYANKTKALDKAQSREREE